MDAMTVGLLFSRKLVILLMWAAPDAFSSEQIGNVLVVKGGTEVAGTTQTDGLFFYAVTYKAEAEMKTLNGWYNSVLYGRSDTETNWYQIQAEDVRSSRATKHDGRLAQVILTRIKGNVAVTVVINELEGGRSLVSLTVYKRPHSNLIKP